MITASSEGVATGNSGGIPGTCDFFSNNNENISLILLHYA